MIDPRIYRAALVPALVAVLVAMFSVESRPTPLPRGLAADELFDPVRAVSDAREILALERPPEAGRRGGARPGRDVPTFVAESLATSDFETTIDRFESGGERLANVIGRRPGTVTSERQLVIVAERDPPGRTGAVSGAVDTGGLLEIARVLEGRNARRTVTVVSLDGGRLDEAGTRRLAERLEPERVEAVLAVSSLGVPGELKAPVIPWASDPTRTGPRLERTTADAVRQELGQVPGQETVPGQLLRLAFPLGIGAQAVALDDGLQSVRFSGSGELPPEQADLESVDRGRLGALGRAALRAVSSLDGRGLAQEAPATYLSGRRQLIPGWSIALVSAALLLPALVTVADGFARVGRRRGRVGAWVVWTLTGAAPFALAYLVLRLLDLVGLVPGLSVATAPAAEPVTTWGIVLLAALLVLVAAGWRFGRRAIVWRVHGLSRPSHPGAAAAVALLVCIGVLALWALNPLAALFFVPAVHLWSGAAVAARPRLGLVLAMAGLVLPLAAGVFYLERLSLDPVSGLWYWVLLLAGGEVGMGAAAVACLLAGAFMSLLAVLAARTGPDAATPPPALADQRGRGPAAYAGPRSLGGTRSVLRR